MGRRSRSRSASHSPSRRHSHHARSSSRRDEHPSSSTRGSSYRVSSRRSRSRSPRHRHGESFASSAPTRRRTSSDVDASDANRHKRMRTDEPDHPKAPSASTASTDTAPLKASTVEKNGEISMSVEETNRVRAALGLKPLSLGPSTSKAAADVVNLQKSSADVEAERTTRELQRKLAQSKTRRALTQKLAGQSIGEQLMASSATSALDWVKQTRTRVDAAAAAAKAPPKASDTAAAAAYDATALAGLVVGHDARAFDDGNEVILTLQDARVLAPDGSDVNDAPDALVNVALAERDQHVARQQQTQRAQLPAYSGVDDDEFVQLGSIGRSSKRPTNTKRLLAQYDDDADRVAQQHAQQFTLDATGSAAAGEASAASTDSSTQQHNGALESDVVVVSLAIDKTKRQSEFWTAAEAAAQVQPRKTKKLRRKKGKAEKEVTSDEGTDAKTLVEQLEADALQHAARDRGRRRRRIASDDDDTNDVAMDDLGGTKDDDDAQLRRFQEAREKANATAASALHAMKRARRRDAVDAADADAAAMELELAQSRQWSQQASAHKTTTRTSPAVVGLSSSLSSTLSPPTMLTSEERIAALVRQTVPSNASALSNDDGVRGDPHAATPHSVMGQVFGAAPPHVHTGLNNNNNAADDDKDAENGARNAVVWNDATDFETRLKSAIAQRSALFEAAAAVRHDASASTSATATASAAAAAALGFSSSRTAASDNSDEEMKGENDTNTNNKDDKDDDDEDDDVWGEQQPLVASGMAATLALLRTTGELRETQAERQAGRANDARDRDVDDALRVKDGVKLDYRDEFGRLLTKKEAFRMLSYKFHGHAPGKKKQEKRLKQLKDELAAQQLHSGEGSSTMMRALEKKQKHAQQAHVVLSGGV